MARKLLARQRQRVIHAYANRVAAKAHLAKAEDEDLDAALAVDVDQRGLRNALASGAARAVTATVNQLATVVQLKDPAALEDTARGHAVDYAERRAGELITDINATTLEGVRALVAEAVAGEWSVDDLADRLEDTGLFSDYRAEMIARTEMSAALNHGTMAAGRVAKSAGIGMTKAWRTADNPCPICIAAEEMGEIALDEDFGDAGDAPPPHPNCQCEVELVVG